MRVAALAAAFGLRDLRALRADTCTPPSPRATPNLRHLEWFHDHVRIESLCFDGTLDPTGGVITPDPAAPGNGLTFKTTDAESFRVK